MDNFTEFCREHKWTILLVAIGLLLAILFMTIGFWKTLLLILVIGIFGLLGFLLDKNGAAGVKAFFDKLFAKDRNE